MDSHNKKHIAATLVITGNKMFTGKGDHPVDGGVAVIDNRIVAVGSMKEIDSYIDSNTKVYRYDNSLILPGFHDHHVHLFCGSLSQTSVWLNNATSEEQAAKMVHQFSKDHHDYPWLYGFGWYHSFWKINELPHRESLDRLISERPVFLFNADLHGAWVNSLALERSNISNDTANPPYGEIVRDAKGKPTGLLIETAMGLVGRHALKLENNILKDLLQKFLEKTAQLGITSVSDMQSLPGMELGEINVYRDFERDGKLTTRIHIVSGLGDNLDKAIRLRDTYATDILKFSALKQFIDGVHTTYTAYMREPYTDKQNTRGITLLPSEVIKKWVMNADREGFRVRLHACGDGAVKLGLDCIEAAQESNVSRDARHSIEHIENIYPEDAYRFGQLGVIASVQPEHLASTKTFANNTYRARLGNKREKFTWPYKTLLNNGAILAIGSDYPVVELNPMLQIYRAVTRVHDDGEPKGGWNPQEKLTIAEVLRGYTAGAAYAASVEKDIGTLEKGKLADIIVLDQDLFEIPTEKILQTKAILTVMDGKIVFER
jgi:predicted amidohydrolase YtcJ